MIALIPARGGSKRIPDKNRKLLAGRPLIAYTIQAAFESCCFDQVVVSTEDGGIYRIATQAGAKVVHRPPAFARDDSPDILWVRDVLPRFEAESFAILRPTSPFRTAATIQRAVQQFRHDEVHSIRAVQPAREHPGKQWWIEHGCLVPVLPRQHPDGTPWHSSPTQSLPHAYSQNASLEIAWAYVVESFGTISGRKIAPFFTEGYEGFDLNTPEDWAEAERLLAAGAVTLPTEALHR